MWTYFVWWLFGAGSDQYPCHLSCWINLIYHLNDLPAQFGRVTSNVNHFSLQKIRMSGMPFKTWLLDLKFENDKVTCFGHRTVMNCFSFQPGSGKYMPNTSKYPNHLSSQISTGWMHLEINAALLAYWHFPNVTFTRRCVDPSLAISSLPFPSCPILTKHQAFAPSGPMTLNLKSRLIRAEFCFRASATAWQETHDLRNTMKHAAHTYRKVAKCFHTRVCFSNWPTPPPTGKKTIRFWPLSLWTLKNLKFFQKHVQIISNHVFKIRLEAIIISPQSVYQVVLLTHIGFQFCCTSSWMVLHPKTWNLELPQQLFTGRLQALGVGVGWLIGWLHSIERYLVRVGVGKPLLAHCIGWLPRYPSVMPASHWKF